MKKKRNNIKTPTFTDKLSLIILILSASLVPLLVRIIALSYPMAQFTWYVDQTDFFDFFTVIKANTILILGFLSLLLLVYNFYKNRTINYKDPVTWLISLLFLFLYLSLLFSVNLYVSLHGFLERYEGVWVISSYLLIFTLTYSKVWKAKDLNVFFKCFWISNIILSSIGILQYFGLDPMTSNYIKPFITSFPLLNSNFTANSVFTVNIISQTLYSHNYVSFYIALSLPIFLSMMLYEHKKSLKIAYALTSFAIIFNLIGCTARSGLVGLIFGMVFWILFNRGLIFKNLKITAVLSIVVVLAFLGVESQTGGYLSHKIMGMFDTPVVHHPIQSVYQSDHDVFIKTDMGMLTIHESKLEDGFFELNYLFNDQPIEPVIGEDQIARFSEIGLETITVSYLDFNDGDYHLSIETDGLRWAFNEIDGVLMLRNPYGNYVTLKETASIGFEGREQMGTSRGYIWSRTLPLILERPLIGYGPDTFPIAFPQDDYLGKHYSYDTKNMVVDKAHNIYLQAAVSSGLPYLFSFILLLGVLFYRAIKTIKSNRWKFINAYQSGLFVSMVSYLIAGLFNDSTVHVSPVFWVFFGLSFVVFKPESETSKLSGK